MLAADCPHRATVLRLAANLCCSSSINHHAIVAADYLERVWSTAHGMHPDITHSCRWFAVDEYIRATDNNWPEGFRVRACQTSV